MIGLGDFRRLVRPLERRISAIIARAVVKRVNNSVSTQRIQASVLAGELVNGVDRMQEYGFESYPWPDSEALVASIAGDRSNAVVVNVHDRRHRPTDLAEGEVCIYTDEDGATPFRIQLKRGSKVEIRGVNAEINVTGTITLQGDLQHKTNTYKIGVWGKTPVAQPSAYVLLNWTPWKIMNCSPSGVLTAVDPICRTVLGTVIKDLMSIGWITPL